MKPPVRILVLLLGLLAGRPAWNAPVVQPQVTLVPSLRCSKAVRPELRLFSPVPGRCQVSLLQSGTVGKAFDVVFSGPATEVSRELDLPGGAGPVTVACRFLDGQGKELARTTRDLDVVGVATRSTQLLDGCWITLYHWSEDEGRWFNKALGQLSAQDWREQILAMGKAGIKHVIVQNVFECDEYAGKHTMATDGYRGKAYYPSRTFPARHALATEDPLEAILAAADEAHLDVFLGVGLYAWFDFSPASLQWHKDVTRELFERYGRHGSLYGWYVSEEMFGSLYHEWEFVKPARYSDIREFFKSYRDFVRQLTPTKPVALAPNNERFENYAAEWQDILQYVDILIPFGFARDADHMNLDAVAAICRPSHTHLWVDMEMFAFPIVEGLVPRTCPELVKEIRAYDGVEQIYGYQFTGLMNPEASGKDLGGDRAKKLYRDYLEYYRRR